MIMMLHSLVVVVISALVGVVVTWRRGLLAPASDMPVCEISRWKYRAFGLPTLGKAVAGHFQRLEDGRMA